MPQTNLPQILHVLRVDLVADLHQTCIAKVEIHSKSLADPHLNPHQNPHVRHTDFAVDLSVALNNAPRESTIISRPHGGIQVFFFVRFHMNPIEKNGGKFHWIPHVRRYSHPYKQG